MNIVFFGSSNFAIPSLEALLTSEHKVSCVVTQPDKQKGRGLLFGGTAIKTIALGSGLRVYQPNNVNTSEAIEFLKSMDCDLFVVIAYGQILSLKVLGIPKILPINIHASLLPEFRGAAPINWALIKGKKTTGITIIKMTLGMDAGPMILQEMTDITTSDTAITLEDKLSKLAAKLILDSLISIKQNDYSLILQNESKATFAPKLKKEDGRIDWSKSAWDIHNLIRGCIVWPGAFAYYNGKLLKIYKASVCPPPPLAGSRRMRRGAARGGIRPLPGEIINVSKQGIVVATANEDLLIEELQIEGKRRMEAKEFIIGHKISAGEILGKK